MTKRTHYLVCDCSNEIYRPITGTGLSINVTYDSDSYGEKEGTKLLKANGYKMKWVGDGIGNKTEEIPPKSNI